MHTTLQDFRKYLEPAVLARVTGLDLRARLLVQGFISGLHRSELHGFSVEFAEHRKYSQGDDLRHLDWKVYGRTDKHYIKEYEQETNLKLLLAVDCSESMRYQSRGSVFSKRDYATTTAAALAYLALHQADAVALATFDTRLHRTGRATNNPAQWKHVVQDLEKADGHGRTAFRTVFDELAETLHDRHLIVIMSDFLGPTDQIISGIKHLRHRRHEPIVLQVLDHAELTFPFDRPIEFEGLEGAGTLVTNPRLMRERYLAEMNAHIERLRRGCFEQRIDFEVLDTQAPLNTALSAYLATRASRSRRRN
ncbi:MAG: DUF58 domain-containing protein [Planctomycetota bacterium]